VEQIINQWLFDETVGKIVAALISIIAVIIFVRVAQRLLSRYIRDTSARYKARKAVVFLGYFLGILVISIVFSERLGNLTVALGVAGAGIAFALQEVIASVAGWFAITLARFYKTGDRVQLGGIKGDVRGRAPPEGLIAVKSQRRPSCSSRVVSTAAMSSNRTRCSVHSQGKWVARHSSMVRFSRVSGSMYQAPP